MPSFRLTSMLPNVALLSLLGSGCSDAGHSLALTSTSSVVLPIIGGTAAAEGDFPAVVALGGCTGTLVRPELVVYAAHCGTAISSVRFGPSSDAPERVVDTDRCRSFPGARLGDGSDLAYCVLAEPVLDIEPERILAGCELADFSAGAPAVIVGYGKDEEAAAYGEKRFAASRIEAIGDEIFLEQVSSDTCRGDSGGPVFVERFEPDGTPQRRLVAVTSAGSESECGRGIAHYVNVTRKLDWLEASSQLDLSPCFAQGSWSPTAACRTASRDATVSPFLASCGEPFDQPDDFDPPELAWTSPAEPSVRLPLPSDATFVEIELAVDAMDAGWGVENVQLSLLANDGEVLFRRSDGIAPYGLPTLRLPPGRFTLAAEARDFAGNTSTKVVAVQVGDQPGPGWTLGGGGCASLARATPGRSGLSATLALLFAAAALRRRGSYSCLRRVRSLRT